MVEVATGWKFQKVALSTATALKNETCNCFIRAINAVGLDIDLLMSSSLAILSNSESFVQNPTAVLFLDFGAEALRVSRIETGKACRIFFSLECSDFGGRELTKNLTRSVMECLKVDESTSKKIFWQMMDACELGKQCVTSENCTFEVNFLLNQ